MMKKMTLLLVGILFSQGVVEYNTFFSESLEIL